MFKVFCKDDEGIWTLATSRNFATYSEAEEYASTVAPIRDPRIMDEFEFYMLLMRQHLAPSSPSF
jgi:hypothetical protein